MMMSAAARLRCLSPCRRPPQGHFALPSTHPSCWRGLQVAPLALSSPHNNNQQHMHIGTWSPLSANFNEVSLKFKPSSWIPAKKTTGLFGIPELTSPAGFQMVQDRSCKEVSQLVDRVVSMDTTPEVVKLFDTLSDALCRVADPIDCIRMIHPDTEYVEAAHKTWLTLGGLVEELNTDVSLYKALKNVAENADVMSQLGAEGRSVAESLLFEFEISGIHLSSDQRSLAVAWHNKILERGSEFGASVEEPVKVPKITVPLPLQTYFGTADSDGNYLIRSLRSESHSELVREFVYRLYYCFDEKRDTILTDLLHSRHQMAQLCGFRTYAHRALHRTILETPKQVSHFLETLSAKLRPITVKNFQTLSDLKQEYVGDSEIHRWDTSYLVALSRHQDNSLTPPSYTPYLSLGSCMDGLDMVFTALYGITLQVLDTESGEICSDDVFKLGVFHDKEGLLGYIYLDLYDRPGKPRQEFHSTIRGGHLTDCGRYQLPVVALMMSFSQGTGQSPTLLSHDMCETLFHEMGHAMHSMLARTCYQHVSGTRCATDFSEVPSTLMEYFVNDPQVLTKFAKHYQTGEAMPLEMAVKLISSKKRFTSCELLDQVCYSMVDQIFHGPPLEKSTTAIFSDVMDQYHYLPAETNTAWHLRFNHLVGYGAKYYSYLLSRGVASLIWQQCFRADPLNRSVGERYRKEMLSPGGGQHPSVLVSNMLQQTLTADSVVEALVSEQEANSS